MDEEVWVPVVGFDKYIISTYGRVANAKTKRVLKVFYNPYPFVSLHRDDRQHSRSVHRLMGYAFLGDIANFDVRHKDGNIHNARLDNLEKVPRKQPRIPRQGRGRGSNRKAIYCVETNLAFDSITLAAQYYNISQSAISQYLLGRLKHVGGLTFAYVDPELEAERIAFQRETRAYKNPVEFVNTGTAYDSIRGAAQDLEVSKYIIHHRLEGKTRYMPNWHFKRL